MSNTFFKFFVVVCLMSIVLGLLAFFLSQEDFRLLMSLIILLIIVLVSIALYFLPTIVAYSSKHRNADAICVLNLVLGWTFIGWTIALVWSFTKNKI